MSQPFRAPLRCWLHRRLHADDRGNLGVLLLLTIWALVVLLAMVWNSGEYATRRRHVQLAADSAAHAGNLWVARTTNLTASSNLVMSQNASAEVILRSIVPTRIAIQGRFVREGERARQLQRGSRQGDPEQGVPDCEHFEELIGFAAWAGKGRGDLRQTELTGLTPDVQRALEQVLPLLPPPQRQQLTRDFADALSQNGIALRWIMEGYIGLSGGGGASPATIPAAGAAVPLGPPVRDWITNDVRPRLADILRTLQVQQAWHDRWVAQTNPALATTVDQLRQVRLDIFDHQQQIRGMTPAVVQEQRDVLAALYKVETTASVPGRPTSASEPALMTAPVDPADQPPGESHLDGIRQRYPDATERRWGSPSPQVLIDPVNVNVDESVIWHPGFTVPVAGIVLQEQIYRGSIGISGGLWGRIPCAPLNRYVNDRVYRDREGLRAEPRAIDEERTSLRSRIHPVPSPPDITALPQQLDILDVAGNPIRLPPRQIPTIPLPASLAPANRSAIEAMNNQVQDFNRELHDFVSDLRALGALVERMHGNVERLTNTASVRFADNAWLRHVDSNRDLVLRRMGYDKHFMVLSTYQLRKIPDWATAEMREDVRRHVFELLYARHIEPATRRMIRELEQWALGVLGVNVPPGGPGRAAIRNQARQFAQQAGPPAARNAVRMAAEVVAREVADEWVRRPWPYEIAPPEEPVPPTRGLTDFERKRHFTSLAAALTTEDSGTRSLLGKYFNQDPGPLVAFAQGEIFNWMEFDDNYGAGDRYDRITFYGHGDMGGSPRPWRLASPGGWNWEPRLAQSDALGEAMAAGSHFREFFEKGGVNANGETAHDAMQSLTKH